MSCRGSKEKTLGFRNSVEVPVGASVTQGILDASGTGRAKAPDICNHDMPPF